MKTTSGTAKYTPAMVKQALRPSECGCCGRSELKKTVPVRPVAGGDVVWMGTGCAARACGMGIPEFRRSVEQVEEAARKAQGAASTAKNAQWAAWLRERTGKDVFEAIRELGGMATARALFRGEVVS